MVINGRPLKRARLPHAVSEVAVGGAGAGAVAPFRHTVAEFLRKEARLMPLPEIFSPSAPPHLLTWRALILRDEGQEIELSVVEEDVMRSRSVYCDQCKVVGWSGHPVCGKRYHFIVENDAAKASGQRRTFCPRCGTEMMASKSRCMLCNHEITGNGSVGCGSVHLEDAAHLLHAVVHTNGYGHLLRVNGREGGSQRLTGRDIMGFWDHLCRMLNVRKVTVMDISRKHGLEYRLLNAVISGHPWYGDWGYKFGAGCYAHTADSYEEAVETLSGIPLSLFFTSCRESTRTQLQNTIALYWSLSDRRIVTVRDLFSFITQLLRESHGTSRNLNHLMAKEMEDEGSSNALCAWTVDDVERAEATMVKILRAVFASRWVSWRALRGATSMAIEPPELLDYALKGLPGKQTDNGFVVVARYNPNTSSIEYRLEAASGQNAVKPGSCKPTTEHLLRDLRFLYDALLNPATMEMHLPTVVRTSAFKAALKILDCKQFIKHYDKHSSSLLPLNPFMVRVWCVIELVDHPKDFTAAPPELLFLPATATIADLKMHASRAFQETYLMFQNFQAVQLPDFLDAGDAFPVKLIVKDDGLIRVRGRCLGDERPIKIFRMERGLDNWTVDCLCGAKDDDGERMMACDTCGEWQHTRCSGISDWEEVPAKFVCRKCVTPKRGRGRPSGSTGSQKLEVVAVSRCKDEIESSIGGAGKFGRLTTVG